MSTPAYELLRSSITDEDCRRTFDYLYPDCVGFNHRASIDSIADHLYGAHGENEIRKARDVVELLRVQFGIAVCSTSGKSGRWLAESEEEKSECLKDFYARRKSIDAVIHALERAKVPPPAKLPYQKPEAVQVKLF